MEGVAVKMEGAAQDTNGSTNGSNGTKRKLELAGGPANKMKKEDLYDVVVTLDWKMEETEAGEKRSLGDPKNYDAQLIERQVLVFNLDYSQKDDFYQEYFGKIKDPKVEKAERVVGAGPGWGGNNFEGIYLVTLSTSEGAKMFNEKELELEHSEVGHLPVMKVVMRQYSMDRWIQSDIVRGKKIGALVKKIEAKVDFEAKKSEGVTVACCVVSSFCQPLGEKKGPVEAATEQEMQEHLVSELKDVLKEAVLFDTYKMKQKGRGYSFVLIFKTKEAAVEYAGYKQVHKYKECPMNVTLLTNMIAKRDFTKKSKNFQDDPAYTAVDDNRRIIATTTAQLAAKNSATGPDRVTWSSQHPWDRAHGDSAILETHFKETRAGVESCHQARIPQLGRPDVVWGLHVVTFSDPADALLALNVTEKDKEVIYRPERMMLLAEFVRRREEALARDQRRQTEVDADTWRYTRAPQLQNERSQKKKKVESGLKTLPDNPQDKHPVSLLLEMLGPLEFKTEQMGEPHMMTFTATVTIKDTTYSGQATSKKAAKKAAAQAAAEGLYGVQYPDLPYGYKTPAPSGQDGQPMDQLPQPIPTL